MMENKVKPTPRDRWYQRFGVLFFGYWLLGAIVAFATPADILSYRWAAAYVDTMSNVIPAINTVKPNAPIHDILKFYLAVIWVPMPIFTWGFYLSMKDSIEILNNFRKKPCFSLFVSLVMLPLLIFLLYTEADPSYWRGRASLSTRMGLALLYSGYFMIVSLFCASALVWLKRIPQIYFDRE